MKVIIKCDYCGKEFEKEIKAKTKNIFCSLKCHHKSRIKLKETKCDFCGKYTKKPPCYLNRAGNHFCSKKCQGLFCSKAAKIKNVSGDTRSNSRARLARALNLNLTSLTNEVEQCKI